MALINNKYEKVGLIGKGAIGTVWHCREVLMDRDVALKMLSAALANDPEMRERFYREARTIVKLQHKNIVEVITMEELDGAPFIVMELLKGSDLRRYIDEKRPLSLVAKLELLAEVCDGLAHAHDQKVVHRDIKPSNIFVHEEEDHLTAKILDFGIARLPTSTLTLSGKMFVGTVNYMAPEQIESHLCNAQSDIFSAAIVFHEFLTYTHPFQSPSINTRIREGHPDTLHGDPLIPLVLADLLKKALENDPKARIENAADFALGLRDVIGELKSERAGNHSTSSKPKNESPETSHAVSGESKTRGAHLEARAIAATAGAGAVPASEYKTAVPLPPAREPWDEVSGEFAPVANTDATEGEAQPSTSSAECVRCRSHNRAGARHCSSCGKSLLDPDATRLEQNGDRVTALAPLRARFVELQLTIGRSAAAIVALVALVVILVFALVSWLANFTRPVTIASFFGTALVQVQSTVLLSAADPKSKPIIALKRGTRVNLLAPYESADTPYVRAQLVTSEVTSRPGFVRSADLGAWQSDRSDVGWKILISRRDNGNSEQALRGFAGQLTEFIGRFPDTAESADAKLELAGIYAKLASQHRELRTERSKWQQDLQNAKETLRMAQRAGASPATIREIHSLIVDLDIPEPDEQPSEQARKLNGGRVSRERIIQLETEGNRLWEKGDLEGVRVILKRLQALEPNGKAAAGFQFRLKQLEDALR